MWLGESSHNGVLGGVEVLKLVHQDVVPTGTHRLRYREIVLETPGGDGDDIVEVDEILFSEIGGVTPEVGALVATQRISL